MPQKTKQVKLPDEQRERILFRVERANNIQRNAQEQIDKLQGEAREMYEQMLKELGISESTHTINLETGEVIENKNVKQKDA